MIASTQITNTEVFAFIAVLAFKLLSHKDLSWLIFTKIANFTGKLLQNYLQNFYDTFEIC